VTVSGINHVTLATGDLDRSIAFYQQTLGCHLRARWSSAAYLEMGDVWLCLSFDPLARTQPHPDYSHIALSVDAGTFGAMKDRVMRATALWKDNTSEGDSIYFLDPDGHRLELHVGTLDTRLAALRASPPPGLEVFE